jgi:hypothetical protein
LNAVCHAWVRAAGRELSPATFSSRDAATFLVVLVEDPMKVIIYIIITITIHFVMLLF